MRLNTMFESTRKYMMNYIAKINIRVYSVPALVLLRPSWTIIIDNSIHFLEAFP